MGFLSLFTRTKEVDYDTYLSGLQSKIQTRQQKLQQIKLRERRANVLLFTYGLALYVLYAVLWYFGIVGARPHDGWYAKAAKATPVVTGPVLILSTRWLMRWFYRRKEAREESIIKVLIKKKQDKVEEIKKKTGYYSTRDLLEKYDEALRKNAESRGSLPGTPVRQGPGGARGPLPASASTPARLSASAGAASGPSTPTNHGRAATAGSIPATPRQDAVPFPSSDDPASLEPRQLHGPAHGPLPPTMPTLPQSRSVMDKLADALLGVSPDESNPYNKYALICSRCFAHNGLVPKEQFDYVQYQCPRCGYFNPRRRDPLQPEPALDPSTHRRVQSMHNPSPLRSFTQLESIPSSPEAPPVRRSGLAHQGEVEAEVDERGVIREGEDRDADRGVESDREDSPVLVEKTMVEGELGTTATRRGGKGSADGEQPRRRRGRGGEASGAGRDDEDEDRMEMD
ncbi:hypothetical protein JCM10212_001183 [Sporobolomyces blumeae]